MASSFSEDMDTRGASREEIRFFHSLAERWVPLSEEIKSVRFRFGEDSDGDPAVWIGVVVAEDLKPSKAKVRKLQETMESFKKDVLISNTKRWPYLSIES